MTHPMQQLDPALVNGVFALNQQAAQQQEVERQRAAAVRARRLAADQLQGNTVGAKGNTIYRAPGALNLAANIMGNIKAGRLEDDADTRSRNMAAQQSDIARRYFAALTGQGRQQQPYMGAEGE